MLTDARALDPTYVPADLQCRQSKVETLMRALATLRRGEPGDHVLIHGPSGAGKTTLAEHTLERLARESMGWDWAYVNCIGDSTKAAALYELARDAGLANDLRKQGTASGTILDRFRQRDEPLVCVLDEVDALTSPDTVVALYETPGVELVLITIDADRYLAGLDQRAHSRVRSAQHLRLDRYGHDEIVQIVQARAEAALSPDAVTADALDAIAERAEGDARLAIGLLRAAAKEAHAADRRQIDAALVAAVEADARDAVRQQHVRTLGTDQRLLFEIVREHGPIGAADLHDRYEARAESPKAKRTRRNYLRSLQEYDLIERRGEGGATEYALAGRALAGRQS